MFGIVKTMYDNLVVLSSEATGTLGRNIVGRHVMDVVTSEGVQAVAVPLVVAVACAAFAKYAHNKAENGDKNSSRTIKAWKVASYVTGAAAAALTVYAAVQGYKASQYTIQSTRNGMQCTENQAVSLDEKRNLTQYNYFYKCTNIKTEKSSNLFGYSKTTTFITGKPGEGLRPLDTPRVVVMENNEGWGDWFTRLRGGTTSMDQALEKAYKAVVEANKTAPQVTFYS